MTPVYHTLTRYLPPRVASVALVLLYSALIVFIVVFLAPRADVNQIYLDVGR